MDKTMIKRWEDCDPREGEMFEHITANEIAGYTVGALLLSATISAPKIDSFISSSQRSSLGMCKRCGDLKVIGCPKCKGSGCLITKQGGPFSLTPVLESKPAVSSCKNCRARGSFPCPQCSLLPPPN